MSQTFRDYCEDPSKCGLGYLIKHLTESLEKNNDLIVKRIEKMEENIIAIREDIAAFRTCQESVSDVRQSITRVHERINVIPQLIDEKIKDLRLDDRFKNIEEKIDSKISYKQITLVVAIISILFTVLNFLFRHLK